MDIDFSALLDEHSVSIRLPALGMPRLQQLGKANITRALGLEAQMREADKTINQKAVDAAYQDAALE